MMDFSGSTDEQDQRTNFNSAQNKNTFQCEIFKFHNITVANDPQLNFIFLLPSLERELSFSDTERHYVL